VLAAVRGLGRIIADASIIPMSVENHQESRLDPIVFLTMLCVRSVDNRG